jgi:glycosyltransferase involved in cell wall biosynthesis
MTEGQAPTGGGQRPLVTFALLGYRQEALVREAIEGAFAQTYAPLEILLSDDASPDGTFAAMEEMAARYDGPHDVRLNRNRRNLGLVGHVNRVFELARGELIVVGAGDDVSLPQRTSTLVEAWLASDRRAKILSSNCMRIDMEGRRLGLFRPSYGIVGEGTGIRDVLTGNMCTIGPAQAWDRELFERFGPMDDTAMIEDRVLLLRGLLLGEVRFVEETLVLYRSGGISWTAGERGAGYNWLYGQHLKNRRWLETTFQCYARDLARVDPVRYRPEIAICERAIEDNAFMINLAERTRARRIAALPRAVSLAARRRRLWPVAEALKYVFDTLYIRLRR